MKMKLLDYTLISLLAGTAQMASAQTAPAQSADAPMGAPATVDCKGNDCTSQDRPKPAELM